MTPTTLVVGPDHHGVVRHAVLVAGGAGITIVRSRCVPRALPVGDVLVIPFTDGLYGPSTTEAAAAYERMTAAATSPIVAVLHDLPGHDGSERSARRRATYRLVAERAQHVVVASEHERALTMGLGIDVPVTVVPLPIIDQPVAPRRSTPPSIGLLGFVYPGKGHDLVLATCRGLPRHVQVIVGGAASAGHDGLVAELMARARRDGRTFTVTGPLDDDGLRRFMASTTVPVVANVAPSASMSLGTWIGAGRRPVALASAYATETAALIPGLVDLATPESMAAAVSSRLADPCRTWRGEAVPEHVGLAAVAAALRRVAEEAGR